jgi:hypothetical protein
MDEENARCKRLTQEASAILAAANGKIKIIDAMRIVGFTTPERKNMKLYQQVRRKQSKFRVVELKNKKKTPSPTATAELTVVTNSQASTISSLTVGEYFSLVGTPGSDNCPVRLDLDADTIPGSQGSTKSEDKKPAAKIPRRTSKEVQRDAASHVMMTKRDKQAMKQATVLIERSNRLAKNHPDKKTMSAFVYNTNALLNSNITTKSAARYVRNGRLWRRLWKDKGSLLIGFRTPRR